MSIILLLIVLAIVFGGGGAFYDGGAYRSQGFGLAGTILIILLTLYLFGMLR